MDDKGFDGINVIPFIDIMLVLLVIVMTTATFIASGSIPLELPRADTDAAAAPPETLLRIEIDRGGIVYFEGTEVALPALRQRFQDQDRQRPVVVRADRAVALQAFVDVMNLLRDLGFAKISLLTEAPT